MLNLLAVKAGDVVQLKDGSLGEVVENIGDGIWLQLRNLATGEEDLVHCEAMQAQVDPQVALADSNTP